MFRQIKHIFFVGFFLSASAQASINFEKTKQEYMSVLDKPYVLLPHKGSFLYPISYNASPNQEVYESLLTVDEKDKNRGDFNRHLEAEFQISFLVLANKNFLETDYYLFFGYTHHSWWQVYNDDWSRPFRETNYEPELFGRKIFNSPVNLGIGKMIMMDLGYVHESNGQIQELSRSWNRFFIRSYFLYENFAANISLWAKIPEKDENSDNKDIQDFRGLGEINLIGVKSFNRFKLRLSPGFTNFGYELNYSIPWREGLRLSVRIGQGYGLSLQDYNHETNRISLGVELAHFL